MSTASIWLACTLCVSAPLYLCRCCLFAAAHSIGNPFYRNRYYSSPNFGLPIDLVSIFSSSFSPYVSRHRFSYCSFNMFLLQRTNIRSPSKTHKQARVYLLSSGFSLAFGSMFAKTYRVHRIFTRSGSSVCKDKMLRDTQLISLVLALLLLDGLVVVTWIVADPMERHLNNLTLEISLTDRSVVYQPQVNWLAHPIILGFTLSRLIRIRH